MSRITILSPPLPHVSKEITDHIKFEMEKRSFLAANELRNASQIVLRGQRHGRRYKVPGTHRRQRDKVDGKMKNGRYYTASAPGEPPAVRTGLFRLSWQPSAYVENGDYISKIESDLQAGEKRHYNLSELLEEGTSKIAPRPHQGAILERAKPRIERIYNEPYF